MGIFGEQSIAGISIRVFFNKAGVDQRLSSARSTRVDKPARPRSANPWHLVLQTRWMDNALSGHVNNVVYYSFFDTAVNRSLIDADVLDPRSSEVIGLVVQTRCEYFAPISFPQPIEVGVRVSRVGNSSVRYELGIFAQGDAPAAQGEFVHVYVDRQTRRPINVPKAMREALARIS